MLSDFQRRPQEVEPTDPQACTLAPSEAEDGTEVRHWPVLAHGVSERGELVGGDHVPDGLRDGRQPDTPARGSRNQLGRTAALRMARRTPYCLRTVDGAALAVHSVTSNWTSAGVIEASGRFPKTGMR